MARRNTRRPQSSGKPAWVWFVLGNFVGGFAVFIFLLSDLKTEKTKVTGTGKSAPQAQAPAEAKPKFDFYKLLEESEVKVAPPKNQQVRVRETDNGAGNKPAEKEEAQPDLVYILQAASFRDKEEAERLRAQLMLANLDVKVESATDSRGTWHRVLVGPYTNRSKVAKARSILAEHRLMPLVLKRPAQG
ncbi:SPOR domain-containing protein [Microbulbifer harenosus]|uniref:Carbamoyl-phosphate synthase small subunit n=1 Tax=Microbulbifer harenosus TaxID=2576840 RepID=A0ABY2ULI5_9GAMM|nr:MULTISPECIES: SPOR domain-containing protein [Microbulbifer]QIL90848.1 carbamoyl-phosphate synthase small subunit [Microbulbifer sp. SH-1]TLM79068.1 carbamoyl-phosphate synthase small subunit [Microbulbifer harenosus]